MDGGKWNIECVHEKFGHYLKAGRLRVHQAFIMLEKY